jgi:hypothetical protein
VTNECVCVCIAGSNRCKRLWAAVDSRSRVGSGSNLGGGKRRRSSRDTQTSLENPGPELGVALSFPPPNIGSSQSVSQPAKDYINNQASVISNPTHPIVDDLLTFLPSHKSVLNVQPHFFYL